jgi:hypothetical protein
MDDVPLIVLETELFSRKPVGLRAALDSACCAGSGAHAFGVAAKRAKGISSCSSTVVTSCKPLPLLAAG